MRHLDLFSGIGGFALAAENVWGENYENAGFCEIEPFCQKVLKKHWPNAKIYDDIKTLKAEDIGPVDLVTGGFPCQPFSAAGKRRGKEDDRHLWPEMLRVIRELSPRWIVAENVSGLLTWNGGMVFDEVLSDLEDAGYVIWAFIIPACAVNAPHRRDRVWIVAHAGRQHGERDEKQGEHENEAEKRNATQLKRPDEGNRTGTDTDAHGNNFFTPNSKSRQSGEQTKQKGRKNFERRSWEENWPEVAAELCAVDDGLSGRLVRPKGWRVAALKAAGNAIVPQVAEVILRGIKTIER